MQSFITGLSQKKIPRIIMIGVSKLVKKILNRFPEKTGICQYISLEALLEGYRDIYLAKQQITLGACAQE